MAENSSPQENILRKTKERNWLLHFKHINQLYPVYQVLNEKMKIDHVNYIWNCNPNIGLNKDEETMHSFTWESVVFVYIR